MTQPPGPPNEPPPYQQPWQGYQGPPPKRSRLPLIIVGGLVLVLVLLVGLGAFVFLTSKSDEKPAAKESPAASTKPSDPKAVEFRRVLTSKPGTCPTPARDGTACDDKGTVYTVGKVELDGSNVTEVKPSYNSTNNYWAVNITLDPDGAKLFGQLTAGLAKQDPPANLLAIVVHGQVVSAPAVQSEISGGQVQITGNFTRDDVEALAKKITG
ncbi:SecDF P1 head subdomain-containing protein [Kribbella sp. GL6]|uniref:SecDF P1 head subdomain-containing protein n=1 Tax=Kribbella sp. GL6 TaxID=3419765 RepID=UPI003D041D6F